MEKEIIVAVGVLFTAFIGLLNLAYSFGNNRRSSYVSSVTATRLKWIGEVRDRLAQLAAGAYEHATVYSGLPDSVEKLKSRKDILTNYMLLRLQLAPHKAPDDKKFEECLETLFGKLDSLSKTDVDAEITSLIQEGQGFLWKEWLKVKDEAIYGDPYDTLEKRFNKMIDRLIDVPKIPED